MSVFANGIISALAVYDLIFGQLVQQGIVRACLCLATIKKPLVNLLHKRL